MLVKAASRLQSIRDTGERSSRQLYDALYYNRKLWTVLVSSVARPENPLPQPIKQNIANLGLFIFDRTLDVQMNPDPEKLEILITINRELAAGLSTEN